MAAETGPGDPMEGRIGRWSDIQSKGVPVMFIDSVLPGHYRMNYSVIGSTASENPDYKPVITAPHRFQIGMFEAPPGNGPGWHTHTYVELFVPLTGRWRFVYGLDGDDPEAIAGEVILEPWDVISFPPGLWRRFENVAETSSVGFAVLDPQDVFAEKDPIWPDWMVALARERGLAADERGRMIKPDRFEELEAEITARIADGGATRAGT